MRPDMTVVEEKLSTWNLKEVLMRKPKNHRRSVQLGLFHPPSKSATWVDLPHEIQQKTIRLIARLMRQHRERSIPDRRAVEAGHE
jgi:hypothetical protein